MEKSRLLPKEIAKKIPNIGATAHVKDPICYVKLFNPCGAGTWWIAEKEKNGDLLYGIADIFVREKGSFLLSEIEALQCSGELQINKTTRIGFTLPVERDLDFTPKPMSEIMNEVRCYG